MKCSAEKGGIEMKNAFSARIATASTTLAAAVLVLAISTLLLAQQSPTKSPSSSSSKPTFYPQPSGADVDRMERDKHFSDLEMIKVISKEKAKPNQRDKEIALKQATEDFKRLLEINEQPLISPGMALDYKDVFEKTAEVERRATRLKSNLLLPVIVAEKKKTASSELDHDQIANPLSDLKKLITKFVTNPVFYSDGSIDPTFQKQAARDLDSIIELSRRISKSAEKLEKNSASK